MCLIAEDKGYRSVSSKHYHSNHKSSPIRTSRAYVGAQGDSSSEMLDDFNFLLEELSSVHLRQNTTVRSLY
jgi:hypothetical protein